MGLSVIAQRVKHRIEDDRATSPTIGAVLLVGITVVVAAVVGGHVISFGGAEQQPFAVASVEFDTTEDRMTVRWQANTNAERLLVTVSVGGHRRTFTLNHVGDTLTVDSSGVTVRKGTVDSWKPDKTIDGTKVSVTVMAKKNGNSVVLTERTERL